MRYILLFLLCSISNLIANEGSWMRVDTLPVPDAPTVSFRYEAIDCADTNNCIAIGNSGWVWPWNRVTTDGGNTWFTTLKDTVVRDEDGHKIYDPAMANEIAYPDTNLCIILCDTGYYWKSTDKCQTWERFKFDTESSLRNIDFYDKMTGGIISYSEAFLTSDGGNTWLTIDDPDFPDTLTGITFVDIAIPEPGVIFLLLAHANKLDYIAKSVDYGETWVTYSTISPRVKKLFFFDGQNGWAAGRSKANSSIYQDNILKTTDGGETWEVKLDSVEDHEKGLEQIYFTDEQHGIAMGNWWKIWRTYDGGETWIKDQTYNENSVKYYFLDIATLGSIDKIIGGFHERGAIYKYTGTEPEKIEDINNDKAVDFKIYPNPAASGSPVNIEINIDRPGDIELNIYNQTGRLMDSPYKTRVIPGIQTLKYTPAKDFPAGIYWIRMRTKGGLLSRAWIVE